jgi:hypothetical protein
MPLQPAAVTQPHACDQNDTPRQRPKSLLVLFFRKERLPSLPFLLYGDIVSFY